MNAPESDSAKQELERAATMILAELAEHGELTAQWDYQRLHRLVMHAYGSGRLAGILFVSQRVDNAHERIARALRELR